MRVCCTTVPAPACPSQACNGEAPAATSRAALAAVAQAHLGALVQQLLASEGLGGAAAELWCPLLVQLAQQAAATLSPMALTANGNIDPRHYIKVNRPAAPLP